MQTVIDFQKPVFACQIFFCVKQLEADRCAMKESFDAHIFCPYIVMKIYLEKVRLF